MRLLAASITLNFVSGCAAIVEPAHAQAPNAREMAAVTASLEHVKPFLPSGKLAINFDYKYGLVRGDSVEWVRPYQMLSPALHARALEIVDAVPFSPERLQWCAPGTTYSPPGCMSAMIIIPGPEITGDRAHTVVLWKMDDGETERRFDLDLNWRDGRWVTVDVREATLYH